MKTSLVDKTPIAMVTPSSAYEDKINTGNVKLVPPGGLRQTVSLEKQMSVKVRHGNIMNRYKKLLPAVLCRF